MWDLVQQCASAMPREILSNLSNFEVKRVCTAPALAVMPNAMATVQTINGGQKANDKSKPTRIKL